jgi:argininosuccinate lyase
VTVRTVQLREDKMSAAASDSFMGATDLADFLVLQGTPFRQAHEIVARAVRHALDSGAALSGVNLTQFAPQFAALPPDYLAPSNIVSRKDASFTRPSSLSFVNQGEKHKTGGE